MMTMTMMRNVIKLVVIKELHLNHRCKTSQKKTLNDVKKTFLHLLFQLYKCCTVVALYCVGSVHGDEL